MSDINTNAELISSILEPLQKLQNDEYFIAFGPRGKQFIGTPNGYSATYLPPKIVAELAGCDILKVLWASFGDNADSWFIVYQFKNNAIRCRLGDGAPKALHDYIDRISNSSKRLLGTLRAQLGQGNSFVVWSQSIWACSNVPEPVLYRLRQLSSGTRGDQGLTMGSLKQGVLFNVLWHPDGSYYIRNGAFHVYDFKANITRGAWEQLGARVTDLAQVALDGYGDSSDTFAFFRRQRLGEEVSFICHFPNEPVQARLYPNEDRLERVSNPSDQPVTFQWATCKRSGSPHKDDPWEAELKAGVKVKVLQDMGNNWYLVECKKGMKGWAHGSWLDFNNCQQQQDAKMAYEQFMGDLQKMLVPGQLQDFPKMANYMDVCAREECKPLKDDSCSVGICAHDLQALLEGSEAYGLQQVKEGRNLWHPDRFARFCHPAAADQLKVKAEQMFVLYGRLMEAF
ncbi:hypothetical protein BKA63DRAFT_134863 [Paraphoma chrysanthemicola]|nr:hypothetical protein BKA63DRAFT_134863 [Paraphoma chrysanthemicola]